jgi:hypothetical protein
MSLSKYVNLNISRVGSLKLASAIVSTYCVYKLVRKLLNRRKYGHIPGPKLNGLLDFFLGNYSALAEHIKLEKTFPEFVAENHEKFGETVKFEFLGDFYVSTVNKEAIKVTLAFLFFFYFKYYC